MSDDEEVTIIDKDLAKEVKTEKELPELFEGGTMRPYQMEGFRWLVVWHEDCRIQLLLTNRDTL